MKMRPLSDSLGLVLTPDGPTELPELGGEEAKALLSEHGVVVFDGFDCDLEGFERFTESLGRVVLDTRQVGGLPEYDFHQEAAWIAPRPPVVWFYCIRPAAGGETKLVDGVQVLEEMGPDLTELFREKPIRYHLDWPDRGSLPTPIKSWQWRLGTDDRAIASEKVDRIPGASHSFAEDGTLHYRFVTSALCESHLNGRLGFANSVLYGVGNKYRVCFADGSKIPEDVIEELNEIVNRLAVVLDWSPQRFAMIDNTRVMHARGRFADQRRAMRARHTQFD